MERLQPAKITVQTPTPLIKSKVDTVNLRAGVTKAEKRINDYRQTMCWLVLAFWAASVLGQDWDGNWHAIVGRDGFWTPPHWMFYSTVTIAGVICAGVIITETVLFHRGFTGTNTTNTTPVLFFFHGPVGFALAGFGMTVMLISAPFDDYWHRIYGIDVAIWTPFHVMLIIGIIMANLGIIYLFASLINNRKKLVLNTSNYTQTRIVAYLKPLFRPLTLGLILATILVMTRYLALMLETFFGSNGVGSLTLGTLKLPASSLTLAVLPLLFVMLNVFLGRTGAATLAGLMYVVWRWLDSSFSDWGIHSMALDRGIAPRNNIFDLLGSTGNSYSFLIMAVVVDAVFLLAWLWSTSHKALSVTRVAVLSSIMGGLTLFLIERPWEGFNKIITDTLNDPATTFGVKLFLKGYLFTPDYLPALPLVLFIALVGGLVATAFATSLRYTER